MQKYTKLRINDHARDLQPTNPRWQAGLQLFELQQGREPNHWKPMASVDMGMNEIWLRDETGVARLFYVAKFEEAVYILHAFEKKPQKTDDRDIEMGKRRYKALIEERRR